MSKIGVMAFTTAFLFTVSGYAADKIAFRCIGTLTDATGRSELIAESTLVIDLNAGLVSGEFGQPSITSKGRLDRSALGKVNEACRRLLGSRRI